MNDIAFFVNCDGFYVNKIMLTENSLRCIFFHICKKHQYIAIDIPSIIPDIVLNEILHFSLLGKLYLPNRDDLVKLTILMMFSFFSILRSAAAQYRCSS